MAKNNTLKYLGIAAAVGAAFYLFRSGKQIKGIGATISATNKEASKYGIVKEENDGGYSLNYKGYRISWFPKEFKYNTVPYLYVIKIKQKTFADTQGNFFKKFKDCISYIDLMTK